MANLEAMHELYKRGALPEKYMPAFEEAMKRGLVPGAEPQAAPQTSSGPQASPEPEADTSLAAQAKRGLGLTGRTALNAFDAVTSPITAPLNAINSYFGGDPEFFSAGKKLGDAMGLPQPQGFGENVATKAGEYLMGAAPFLAASKIPAVMQAAPKVAEFLGASPKLQLASAATGGAAEGWAKDANVGPGGQMAAGLFGGLVPGAAMAAASTGKRLVNGIAQGIDSFTDAGRKRIAGKILADAHGDIDALEHSIDNAKTLVQGSDPTLAQVTASPKLASLEHTLQNTAPDGAGAELTQRYIDQRNARKDAAMRSIDSNLSNTMTESEAGPGLRQVYDANYEQAKQKTRNAYDAIDPDRKITMEPSELHQEWTVHFQDHPEDVRYIPDSVNKEIAHLNGLVKDAEPLTYHDAQAMRASLSSTAHELENTDRNGHRIVTAMLKKLDSFMESKLANSAEWKAAKQTRLEQGDNFERGVNKILSQSGDKLDHSDIDPSRIPALFARKNSAGGAEAIEAFTRSMQNNPKAVKSLEGYIQNLLKNLLIDPNDNVRLNKLAQFTTDYSDLLGAMPTVKANIRRLQRQLAPIRADEQRSKVAEGLAKTRGSQTAKNLTAQSRIQNMPYIDGLVGNLLKKVGKFVGDGSDVVSLNLLDAMLNPQNAKSYLRAHREGQKGIGGWLRGANSEKWGDVMKNYLRATGAQTGRTLLTGGR